MEVSRGEHVSVLMLRSICCRNKVADAEHTEIIIDYKNTVFIYGSTELLGRRLLGSLSTCLELAGLTVFTLKVDVASPGSLRSSSLIAQPKEGDSSMKPSPALFSLWKGDDAFRIAFEVCKRFAETNNLPPEALLCTDTAGSTRIEAEIWFTKEALLASIPSTSAVAVALAVTNGEVGVDVKQDDDGGDDTTLPEVEDLAPPPQLPHPEHPEHADEAEQAEAEAKEVHSIRTASPEPLEHAAAAAAQGEEPSPKEVPVTTVTSATEAEHPPHEVPHEGSAKEAVTA